MILIHNNKGVTLIELLIAIALMSLVLSIGYNLYFYGTKSFAGGTMQAHVQQNARIVDEYFRNELRNAGQIVMDAEGRETEFDYYFKVKDNKLYKNEVAVTPDTIIDIEVKIISIINNGRVRSLMSYEVTSSDGEQEYKYTNQILLNNINTLFPVIYKDMRSLNVDNVDGLVIYYSYNT